MIFGAEISLGFAADDLLGSSQFLRLASTDADVVELYRFVSQAELDDIKNTGIFRPAPGHMEAKQFGRNLEEIEDLATHPFFSDDDLGGIVKIVIPESALNNFDLTPVDKHILKSGSVTARGEKQLEILSQVIIGPIEVIH